MVSTAVTQFNGVHSTLVHPFNIRTNLHWTYTNNLIFVYRTASSSFPCLYSTSALPIHLHPQFNNYPPYLQIGTHTMFVCTMGTEFYATISVERNVSNTLSLYCRFFSILFTTRFLCSLSQYCRHHQCCLIMAGQCQRIGYLLESLEGDILPVLDHAQNSW